MRAWMWIPLVVMGLAGCASIDPVEEIVDDVAAPLDEGLRMLPSVDLQCPEYVTYRDNCAGFGEPTLDVAGDGTIWYSAVCCVGQSPPIWVSRDGGESFQALPFAERTGAVRDVFGIEGDFAIDDAGNVYFFDIGLGSSWFTKYEADGTHVFTKADPFPPLVDRPWVRAGAEDEVFIVYNSGIDSWFYRSTDGGLTWSYPGHNFGCNLAGFGQGATRDHLIVAACLTIWQSFDGGLTWDMGQRIDVQGQTRGSGPHSSAFADDAGIVYLPYIRLSQDDDSEVMVAALHPDGTQVLHTVATGGIADYPWLVAGHEGAVAVAYYAADNVTYETQSDAQWKLRIAYTEEAHQSDASWTVLDGDPEVLFEGAIGRQPGDFLQIRHTPEGDLVVAYAARVPYGGELVNRFVRSTGMDLGHAVFLNGPQP